MRAVKQAQLQGQQLLQLVRMLALRALLWIFGPVQHQLMHQGMPRLRCSRLTNMGCRSDRLLHCGNSQAHPREMLLLLVLLLRQHVQLLPQVTALCSCHRLGLHLRQQIRLPGSVYWQGLDLQVPMSSTSTRVPLMPLYRQLCRLHLHLCTRLGSTLTARAIVQGPGAQMQGRAQLPVPEHPCRLSFRRCGHPLRHRWQVRTVTLQARTRVVLS